MGNSIFHNLHAQYIPDKYPDRVYGTYFLIEIMIKDGRSQDPMSGIGKKYNQDLHEDFRGNNFEIFNDLFLEPFVFFFLNQTDRSVFFLGLLKRYKQRAEWFNKVELSSLVQQSQIAEKLLKEDLCMYLYDEGAELYIEPSSQSGEIDVIAVDNSSEQKALIEAKIFDGNSRSKSYMIKGYHQTDAYLKDHVQNKGYLIIYNLSSTLLSINANPGVTFPYVIRDNRLIYFVVVDIYQHDKPASVRGARDIIEIKEQDLL